jgi:4-amino-4-deoxy-L-arabinose transferase
MNMADHLETLQDTESRRRYAALLLLFFLLAYLLPLGFRDLLVPDETRYAEIPREMIATGDWGIPHLNGLRYFEKPPLGYWVHAGSLLVFGENNFAVRLPSALAAGLTALLIFALIARLGCMASGSNDVTGLLAALIFLSCFEVAGVSNMATLDGLFTLFLTLTIAAFYVATEKPRGSASEKYFLLLAGLACGLSFLTKGFLAIVLPVSVLVPYLVWQRRYIDLLRMSWMPLIAASLVALPWSWYIQIKEPDFWTYFFWNEHIHRFMAASAQHKAPFWFFLAAAPGLFMPWSFVTPAAAAGLRSMTGDVGPRGRLIRFSICWLALPFLFFSISKGKLLTYILPCFPPFAILVSFGLMQRRAMAKDRIFAAGVAATGIGWVLVLLAFIWFQIFSSAGTRPYSQPWKAMMVVNGIVFMVLFCFWSLRNPKGADRVVLLGLAPLMFLFVAHFAVPDLAIRQSVPERLLEKNLNRMKADDVIISCEEAIGAACWTLKCDNAYLLRPAGELTYGLGYKDSAGRLLDAASAARLIERNRGHVAIIARPDRVRDLRHALPPPAFQDDSGPEGYVLWRY